MNDSYFRFSHIDQNTFVICSESGLEAIQFLRDWKLTELIQKSSETKSLFPWLKPLYNASVQMSSCTSIYLPDNEENSIKVI